MEIEKENKMVVIFIDFKRAFDAIGRDIMLKKLYMYGIRQIELEWFKSCLENR